MKKKKNILEQPIAKFTQVMLVGKAKLSCLHHSCVVQ